jgi:hypothetical protein
MPKKVIDNEQLIFLAQQIKSDGKPWTHQEMADDLGCSRTAVTRALMKLPPALLEARDVTKFREKRADIFAEVQREIMKYITPEKLKNASLAQLGTLFGIFYDKERLEAGQPNVIAAQFNVDMDPETMKIVRKAIQTKTENTLKSINRD